MADIMELMRMPDQAKRMREYKPQADPMEQKMKELQMENLVLENESLKALVKDRHARAGENIVDAELKRNKAAVEAAKARQINSSTDMSDLQFVKEDEGFAHMEKVELEDLKHAQRLEKDAIDHRANLEQMYAQYLTGDKNIGVRQ
jgi:hypothetical protein